MKRFLSLFLSVMMTLCFNIQAAEEPFTPQSTPGNLPSPTIEVNLGNIQELIDAITGGGGSGESGSTAEVGNTTTTINLFHFGGNVRIATATFIPIDGLFWRPSSCAKLHILSWEGYAGYGSSVTVTKMEVRKSTDITAPPTTWVPASPQVHTGTATTAGAAVYNTPISSTVIVHETESLSLAISSVAPSGLVSHDVGINVRAWWNESGCNP